MQRVGISIDSRLLAGFDELITRQGYSNRSEAFRDIIRQKLSDEELQNPQSTAVAAVIIVYDHHQADLAKKLTGIQHSNVVNTISSMHVHLDLHNCLEVILLRGKVGNIQKLADNIVSLRGVRLGRVNLVASEQAE